VCTFADRAILFFSIVMTVGLLAGLPTPCAAQVNDARSAAWEAYSRASEALAECRARGRGSPPPCPVAKAAAEAAEARYRAEIGATQATKQP
jgi:hypothetical protein